MQPERVTSVPKRNQETNDIHLNTHMNVMQDQIWKQRTTSQYEVNRVSVPLEDSWWKRYYRGGHGNENLGEEEFKYQHKKFRTSLELISE